jgi:hypothetical protein
LWSCEPKRGQHEERIQIFSVAKHDEVPNKLELMSDAYKRMSTHRETANAGQAEEDKDGVNPPVQQDELLLDPTGNTPLKRYIVRRDQLERLVSKTWDPPLLLTSTEMSIVNGNGTNEGVMVLGRSGTGKTVCIIARMDRDSEQNEDRQFRQLFCAKSSRLCRYVREMLRRKQSKSVCCDRTVTRTAMELGHQPRAEFMAFHKVLDSLEQKAGGAVESAKKSLGVFEASEPLVDYNIFKNKYFPELRDRQKRRMATDAAETSSIIEDSQTLYTQIRSYIKGSVQAAQQQRHLSLDEYLGVGEKAPNVAIGCSRIHTPTHSYLPLSDPDQARSSALSTNTGVDRHTRCSSTTKSFFLRALAARTKHQGYST